jgi:hypothetical protein
MARAQTVLSVPFPLLQGWCVFAAQAIPQGSFVCQYVGEYVTAAEARRRLAAYDQDTGKGHALLVGRLQCSLGVLLCLLWPVGCFGETGAGGGGHCREGGRVKPAHAVYEMGSQGRCTLSARVA